MDPQTKAEVVLLLMGAAVLLLIILLNLPPAEGALERGLVCTEWTQWQQIEKGRGMVGHVEWCSEYGESDE